MLAATFGCSLLPVGAGTRLGDDIDFVAVPGRGLHRVPTTFREERDVQSRFHDYSYRNTFLIKHQCPEATRVAGYWTWQEAFDRHVREVEAFVLLNVRPKPCKYLSLSIAAMVDSDSDWQYRQYWPSCYEPLPVDSYS